MYRRSYSRFPCPAVGALEEGTDRVAAEQRVDGHDVRPQHVEQRSRVGGRRVADVAALGVEDQDVIGRHVRAQPLKDRVSGGPELLEEGEVRFEGADVLRRRLDDVEAVALGVGGLRRTHLVERRTEERSGRFDARVQACDERHGATRPPLRARLDRALIGARRVRCLDAFLLGRGAERADTRHPAVEDHRCKAEDRLAVRSCRRC